VEDVETAEWDAIHIVTTNIDPNFNKAEYLVNSTVFLTLDASNAAKFGSLDCGCSVLRIKKDQKSINVKPEEMQ
jgi:capping protein beta